MSQQQRQYCPESDKIYIIFIFIIMLNLRTDKIFYESKSTRQNIIAIGAAIGRQR